MPVPYDVKYSKSCLESMDEFERIARDCEKLPGAWQVQMRAEHEYTKACIRWADNYESMLNDSYVVYRIKQNMAKDAEKTVKETVSDTK